MKSAFTVLYCHLRPAQLYNISPRYLINGRIFEKRKVIEHEMCSDFLYKYCLRLLFNPTHAITYAIKHQLSGFSGLVVSMLVSGTQVCGFKPG